MKDLTIIGGGAAGLAFIEKIRSRDNDVKITLIDEFDYFFDNRDFISLNLRKRLEFKEWCAKHKVLFVLGAVERINPSRKKIYFKEGQPVDFDVLIAACGVKPRKIEVKGDHREGFFYLSHVDPLKMRDLLKISKDISVYVSTFLGLRLAMSLRFLKKDVTIFAEDWSFLAEDKDRVTKFLQDKGVEVHFNCRLDEAIGEGVVKALKVMPLKVFSADMLFVDSGMLSNRDIFEEPMILNPDFSTNFSDVYLAGACANLSIEKERFFAYNYQLNQENGRALAEFLLTGNIPVLEEKILSESERKKIIDDFVGGGSCSCLPAQNQNC